MILGIQNIAEDRRLKRIVEWFLFFFYSVGDAKKREKLEARLRGIASSERIETYRDLPSFSRRIKIPLGEETMVIMKPGDREELREIFRFQDRLENCRIVIIAPDKE